MVEQEAVNFEVAGSSPAVGAKMITLKDLLIEGLFVIIKLMIKNSQNQTGSAHIVIIIILVVAVIGLLGFIFWQNFITPKDETTKQAISSQHENESEADLYKGYLFLDDWSIKFKIPEGLTGIKYYKVTGYDSYELTTSRVEELGGDCKEPAVDKVPGVIRLGGISRESKPIDSEYVLKLNNGQPINGYYYSYAAAQSTCAYSDPEGVQQIDRDLLSNMVNNIEAK